MQVVPLQRGLGASAKGRRLIFDMLVPPGYDVIPVDVFRRELQALHGGAVQLLNAVDPERLKARRLVW
jgi:hypothetical protein